MAQQYDDARRALENPELRKLFQKEMEKALENPFIVPKKRTEKERKKEYEKSEFWKGSK